MLLNISIHKDVINEDVKYWIKYVAKKLRYTHLESFLYDKLGLTSVQILKKLGYKCELETYCNRYLLESFDVNNFMVKLCTVYYSKENKVI